MVRNPADPASHSVGVVTVDDQPLFRQAARAVIDATPGFALLGEAGTGEEAVGLAARLQPDLMIVDYRLPGISGLETSARLARLRPRPFVLLVSSDAGPALPELAVAHGAVAFLPKHALRSRALRDVWERRYPDDSESESSAM
jgi:DNA-binding NarL/FixJ family response regulator